MNSSSGPIFIISIVLPPLCVSIGCLVSVLCLQNNNDNNNNIKSLPKTIDLALETTVALSSSAFWQLAHSEAFYRDTRLPSGNVRQRVSEVSDQAQGD